MTAAQIDAERKDRRCGGSDEQKARRSATYDGVMDTVEL